MSGKHIVGTLMREDSAITARVVVANIKIGKLPPNITLPALVITETTQNERQALKRGAKVRTVDRVSVTGRFRSDRERTEIMQLVKDCCAGLTGSVAGASNVSILTAGRGPDLNGPADSFEKTQDFRVSYDA